MTSHQQSFYLETQRIRRSHSSRQQRGYTLPANSIANHPRDGDRDDYKSKVSLDIWHMTKFQLTSATLTPNSLSVAVENTGNATINFHLVALTSTTTPSGGWVPSTALGPVSRISEFFVVVPNGSLVPFNSDSKQGAVQTLALSGYTLAPGTSVTFTYNGAITIGALGITPGTDSNSRGIQAGQRYIVTIFGSGLHAQTAVTVSGATTTASSTSTTSATGTSTVSSTETSSSSTTSISTTTSSETSTSTSSETSTSTSGD